MSSAAGVHGVKQNLVGNSVSRVMDCEVAVIGAGPYGLAAAAHLKSKGIEVRVFGRPMELIKPAGVSHSLGGSLPWRGSTVIVFDTNA